MMIRSPIRGVLTFVVLSCVLAGWAYSQTGADNQLRPATGDQAQTGGQEFQDPGPVSNNFPAVPPEEQAYLELLLDHWEKSSAQLKQCTCEFRRWEYDPAKVNWRNPVDNRLAAYTISDGVIRFASPDKACFETESMWVFEKPPMEAGADATYKQIESPGTLFEKWVCDGRAIYAFDFQNKVLWEESIPEELQQAGLINSPLPFLFGAKKQQILDRYYVRVVTPQGVENEYWLEAFPKTIDDARNYSRVQIVIAQEDFLPKSIHVFHKDYDAQNQSNLIESHYQFGNRKINGQLAQVLDYMNLFIRPQTPIGWERKDVLNPSTATSAQQMPVESQKR